MKLLKALCFGGNRNSTLLSASLIAASLGFTAVPGVAQAQAGGTQLLGQLAFVPYNFTPRGWANCDGQLLPISQYSALFSLLGTTYGGDGRTTFGLPDMRGRFPMHVGNGPGLSPRQLGEKAGSETHNLTVNQMPAHSHTAKGTTEAATTSNPNNAVPAAPDALPLQGAPAVNTYKTSPTTTTNLSSAAISNTGNNQAVNHMSPYIGVRCIIALEGVYPSRN